MFWKKYLFQKDVYSMFSMKKLQTLRKLTGFIKLLLVKSC